MAKSIRILAVVLAVQILLALGLHFRGPGLSPAAEAGPLLSVSPDEVSRITLADTENKQVKLKRTDGHWTLTDSGFPADPDKVSQLLNQLTGLSAGEVVARTEGARERFKVASKNFKRRITLHTRDQDPVRLYLGTSPGKDRIHARVEGHKPIQVVRLGTYDAPVEVADWQDKGVLQIPSDRIAGLELDGLKLQRKDSGQPAKDGPKSAQPAQWQAAKTRADKTVRQSTVRQLTQQLATLRFDEILGEEKPGGYNWDQPGLQLTIQRTEGDPVQYRLARKSVKKDQTEYALKASSRAEYFKLSKPAASQLLNAADPDKLLTTEEESRSGREKKDGRNREESEE